MADAKPEAPVREISGIRKAAILLVSLQPELASQIIGRLDKDAIERVMMEVAKLEDVEAKERNAVLEEFYHMNLAREYIEQGGVDYARMLLQRTLPEEEADRIMQIVEQAVKLTPFSFLQKAQPENLLAFIQDEHPQTIALILAHIGPQQAAAILAGLPLKKQIDVVKRVANMERTSPEVIEEVEQALEKRIATVVTRELEKVGGAKNVAEILNLADRATERGILENLEEEDPDLVDQIRRLMFIFEDILLVNDRGIQNVLREVDTGQLALALKTAKEEVKEKIFRNMSKRAVEIAQEEMEYMGPVRLSEVEAAQQAIVDVIRRLEEAGEVIIQGRGEEEIIV